MNTDKVKLIIEISKDAYDATRGDVFLHDIAFDIWLATMNGIPLNNVKAKIEDLRNQNLFGAVSNHDLLNVVLEIFDNIRDNKQMNEVHFEVVNDVVVRYTPMPEIGRNCYKTEIVMNKETFQECYKKWIELQENGK